MCMGVEGDEKEVGRVWRGDGKEVERVWKGGGKGVKTRSAG